MLQQDRGLRRKLFFSAQSARLSRCLAPSGACGNGAIRAHSVQNSTVMGLLHRNGHVKVPGYTMSSDDSFSTSWNDIGRNLATTFEGFCSAHDSAIFLPIDTQEFDSTNHEQLFLYAYRSAVHELHASMEAAIKMQTGYEMRIEAGLDTGEHPEEAGLRAVDQMIVAHSTYVYKSTLDRALLSRRFQVLKHEIFRLPDQIPTMAVSACFDLANRPTREDPPRAALNIFPTSPQETVIIFSFTDDDTAAVQEYIAAIRTATGVYQKYLISRMVLMHAENFVIAPSTFDMWSEEKRAKILEFFLKTLRFDSPDESEHLCLF